MTRAGYAGQALRALLALLLCVSPVLGIAQAGDAKSDDETHLLELNERWLQAYPGKDVEALDRILADDFVQYRAQTGERTDKAAFLAGIRDGKAVIESVQSDEVWVHVDGDTALVTGRSQLIRRNAEGRVKVINRYLDVYVKRDGTWRAIAAKVTRIGEEKL